MSSYRQHFQVFLTRHNAYTMKFTLVLCTLGWNFVHPLMVQQSSLATFRTFHGPLHTQPCTYCSAWSPWLCLFWTGQWVRITVWSVSGCCTKPHVDGDSLRRIYPLPVTVPLFLQQFYGSGGLSGHTIHALACPAPSSVFQDY